MKKQFKLFITAIIAVTMCSVLLAADGIWTATANGNWSDGGNWDGGIVAGGSGATAEFTNAIPGTVDCVIDTATTIGNINFADGDAVPNNRDLEPGNILTLAGGSTINADASVAQSNIKCVLDGTEGFTLTGDGIVNIGNTSNLISGTVTLNTTTTVKGNHKDAFMNADLVVGTSQVESRKNEFNAKTITVNNTGILDLFQTDAAGFPVKVQADSITVNNGGTLGAGNDPAAPLVGESFELLSPSITINSGGRIKVIAPNAKSVGGSNITVLAGGEVGFFNNNQTYTLNNPLVLDGWGIAPSLGALTVQGLNNLTNNGPITLTGNTRIGMWGGGDNYMVMNGPISGGGPCILLAQAGHPTHIRRFELHAANTYTGDSKIEGFACQNITTLFGNQRLPHTPLTLQIHNWSSDTASTFDLNGYTQEVITLTVAPGLGGDLIKIIGGGELRVTSNNVDVIAGNFEISNVSLIANKYILVRSGNKMTVSNAYIYCGLELMPGIAASPGTVVLDNGAEANVFVTRVGIDPSVEANDVGIYYLKSGSILKTAAAQNSGGGASGLGFGSAIYYDGGTLSDGLWNDWSGSYADWIRQGFSNVVQLGGAKIEINNVNGRAILVPFIHDPALGGTPDGGLTKLGAGTLTLNAVSTYTGPTVISEGKLIVDGDISASSGITLASSAAIGGSGTVGALTIPDGATISPGASIGTLSSGSITMESGSEYDWEVGDPVSADLLDVTGTFSIPIAGMTVNAIAAGSPGGTYTLVQTTGGIIGNPNDITMNYIGTLSGSAAYVSGNDLLADVVPEPATLGLLAILGLAFLRRK